MGKDKKSKYGNPAKQWIDSMKGKNRDLEERFGIDRVSFGGRPGESGQREAFQDMKSYNERITDAARNDYDMRRTLEAAAMSGKKKAQTILDRGFNSIDDVRKAQKFSEKAAKRHGQGGSFSSNSDYMGLTQSMVERDRRKHDQAIDKRFENFMEERGDQEEDLPELTIDNPIGQRGGRENNTADVYDDYQDAYKLAGISDNYYSTGGEGQASTEESVGSAPAGATDQLKEFQNKIKTGMALAGVQTRGPQSGIVPGDGF